MAAKKGSKAGGSKRKTSKSKATANTPAKHKPTKVAVTRKTTGSTLTQRRLAAGPQFKAWSNDLFLIYEKMDGLIKAAGFTVLHTSYAVGALLVHAIDQPRTYGNKVDETLATEIGVPIEKLRDCGYIARAWSPIDFQTLMNRKNAKGRRLTYSHMVEIAQRDITRRPALIQVTLANSLTVAELKAAIKATKTPTLPSTTPTTTSKIDKTKTGIKRAIAKYSSAVDTIPLNDRDWQDRVTQPLTQNPVLLDADITVMLHDKKTANIAAINTLQAENKQIDAMLASQSTQATTAKPAKPTKPTKPTKQTKSGLGIIPHLINPPKSSKELSAALGTKSSTKTKGGK